MRFLHRLVLRLGTQALLTIIGFALAHAAPGDPAELILRGGGNEPAPEAVTAMRGKLGLDQPIPAQYFSWLGHIARLDFGTSFASGQPVASEFLDRLPATLELTGAALLLTILLGLGSGLVAVRRRGWTERLIRFAALMGSSAPSYWVGLLLISLFSVKLGWLPVAGITSWQSLLLPALALALAYIPLQARLFRASLLAALAEPLARVAFGKGLSARAVLLRHALPRALGPNIQALGLAAGQMIGGAIVIETVFSWPGVGQLATESLLRRDYPIVETYMLVLGAGFILVTFAADALQAWLDPTARDVLLDLLEAA
ncbi:MAG: ABC transporter permease [Chloroflexi bacterium]|nr:ABC transporter permease [Chloroflexota bacterium]